MLPRLSTVLRPGAALAALLFLPAAAAHGQSLLTRGGPFFLPPPHVQPAFFLPRGLPQRPVAPMLPGQAGGSFAGGGPAGGGRTPAAMPVGPAFPAGTASLLPGQACRAAIAAAEQRYGIPTGLLAAIGEVESGRTDPATGARLPWPWTVNAEGEGHFFDSKEAAIAWVRAALARGIQSIDTGCMQVNLYHHPDAFASLEAAFDPATNADYAARFLRSLHDGPAGGNWMIAAGYYHSQTPELAAPYRAQVEAALNGRLPAADAPAPLQAVSLASRFAMPGGGGESLSNGSEHARILPMAQGMVGHSLAFYRARPVLIAGRWNPR